MRLVWRFTNLKFLPVGTQNIILNRKLNLDHISDEPVGQLPVGKSDFVIDYRNPLPLLPKKDHMCHPEWFATGEPFPNDLPPTVYTQNLLPECCGLFFDSLAGGVEVGGEFGDVYRPSDALAGGVEVGGEFGDVYRPSDALAGGVEVGGEFGDVYIPAPTVPGNSCATAGNALHNNTYSGSITNPAEDWYLYPIATTGVYNVVYTTVSGAPAFDIYTGTSCGTLNFVITVTGSGSHATFCPTPQNIYVKVRSPSGTVSYSTSLNP